ncbi:MAG: DNA polymerase III subunit delta', partial [Betaproteobacteria bacterium]|nr:DNA polymerase III subunit delta' [Betaproteobacteria bacterium]
MEARTRLPHALLLIGPEGTGKLDFATFLAQSLLCEAPAPGAEACGKCPACGWFAAGNHPDFRLVQPEALEQKAEGEGAPDEKPSSRQIAVEQVRGLSHFIVLSPHRRGLKVILMHPAEALNVNAANALLKNLEEPPAGTLFLLVTHRPR